MGQKRVKKAEKGGFRRAKHRLDRKAWGFYAAKP
jgi:hypothetical protein